MFGHLVGIPSQLYEQFTALLNFQKNESDMIKANWLELYFQTLRNISEFLNV